MKIRSWLFAALVFCSGKMLCQTKTNQPVKDSLFFNYAYWNGLAEKRNLNAAEKVEFIEGQKQLFEQEHNHTHIKEENIIWVTAPAPKKGFGQNTINAGPCTNIDFESGTMAGWTRSRGFNPLFNSAGCCASPNGDQTIVTAGVDPFGNFPMVYPGGGSFSLRLGSTAVGGIADRISQTFFVTPANANFTYRYALVLNDGGHPISQQPRFTSEIVDSLDNPVPCTFYQASAGTNTSGLLTSTMNAGNGSSVSYKPWTDVLVDLTPNIGQNVTLRFTVYDCGPSGHFAYAYIDGTCTSFTTSAADTTCPNVPFVMCVPVGFSANAWNGPGGVTNNPNQCINVSTAGVYTCTTLLSAGCTGPTFTHTLSLHPQPVISFTPVGAGPCLPQFTFNSTSNISSGSITSYTWSFGDGVGSTASDPTHIYTGPGTYTVKLKATSNRGCSDSTFSSVTVFPSPTLAFSPPSNCVNTSMQFTNNSSISPGSISGYTWDLGNNMLSNAVNPTNTYTAMGTYTINLIAISDQGCTSTQSQTLGIFPAPIVSFSANSLCDKNGTAFTPATSTAIASGSLASFLWNFGDGGTSTSANPTHIYVGPGTYTITLVATSNNNCTATATNTLSISPSPTVAFTTTSVNACSTTFTFANNSGITPPSPLSYTWNFGGGNTSTTTASSLTYTFPGIGNYTVSLLGVSNMNCPDSVVQYISIHPYPVISLNAPASCENAVFSVSTTAVSGSVTSYQWDFGDPASGAANTSTLHYPTHIYASTNNYTITLNLVSNLNCPSSTVLPITVFPNPTAIFTYSTLNNCSLPYTYQQTSTVSTIGSSSITGYFWNFGAAGTSTLVNPGTVSFPSNGTHSVSLIVTTNHNCTDTLSYMVPVHPLPQLAFTTTPICQNLPASFPNTSSIANNPAPASISSFTWSFGDNLFAGVANPLPHTYTASGTYTVQFSATSNMGCVTTVTNTQLMFPVPVANFTVSDVCFGNAAVFNSTSSVGSPGLIVSHNWGLGDGVMNSNPSISHTYTAPSGYAVSFSVTTSDECMVVVDKTVNVHPLPVISFSANGGCFNVQSLFSTTSSISAGSINSYTWNLGDGNSAFAQNPSHTYSVYGTYIPTVTAISDKGCITSTVNTVVIHPLPVISFSAPSLCGNLPVQFANSSSIAIGSISTYTWTFGDGNSSTTFTPIHTYTVTGLKTVSLTATSNQGCVSSGTTTLNVHPYPTSTLTTINSSCINELVSFNSNLGITSGSIPSTTVSFGDASVSTFTATTSLTVSHTYTTYNTFTINITAVSDMGCQSTFTNTVNVYPKPFVSFVPSNFCYRDSTFFNNTSIIPTGSISSHYWTFTDGSASSTIKNPKHKFSAAGNYTVTLTEFSQPEAGLTCSLNASQVVTVNPLPVPSFSTNTVCQGFTTLFGNLTPSAGIIGWTWDFTNDATADDTQQNPGFIYAAAGTYTASLVAKNNFNCTDTVRSPVMVYSNPTVAFTAPNVCLGNVTTFTNQTIAPAGTILTYLWNFGDSDTSATQNPAHTYTPHNAYTVTLKATSNQGCTKTFSNTLLIHPLPVLTFSAPNVCDNAPVQFVNTSSINPGFIATYGWDFADGNTSSTMSPIHTFTGTGLKTVSLTATSNQGCVSSGTTTLNVHPYPTSTLTTINSSCINELVSFNSNLGITSGSIPSTTVSFGDASASTFTATTSLTVSHTYTTYNTFTINITAVSDMGCQSTFTNTVNVYSKPFVSFVPSNFCYRDSTFFNNTSIIPTGSISSHYWTFTDGSASSTIKNPKHKFSAAGNYTVTLTEFSQPEAGLTCSLNASQVVTVNPLPVPSFSTNTVCQGFTTLFGNLTPSAGITGWTWDFTNDATADDTQQNPGFIYAAAGTYTASLVAKNNFNCTDTVRSPVMVYSNPTVAFTAPNVCLGNVTTFTNQTIAPAGTILTYLWNFGDSDTSATQNPAHTYTPHNAYTVTLKATSNQGCTKTFSNTLLIHPLPVLTFSAPNVCDNAPVQFVNTSSINPGFIATYGWDFADGNTSSTMSPIHTFTGTGLKTVSLTATSNQGCVSSGTTTLNVHPYPTNTLTTINSSCINELVSFNSNLGITSGSIPSTTVSFGDASASTFTATTSLTVSHTYTTYNTFTINITAVSDMGCQSTFTNTVNVYPKPFVSFVPSNFCYRDSTFFNNTSIIPTGSISSHYWTFTDGSASSTIKNPKHKFSAAGNYTVTLTEFSQPEAGLTCSLNASQVVTVNPLPVPSFSTNTVCQGFTTLFGNLTPSAGIIGWTWDFTNDATADDTQQNPGFIYAAAGTYTASLVAKNNFNCTDTVRSPVMVYSNPTVAFTAPNVCLGNVTTFTNQTIAPAGTILTYLWNFGDSDTSATQNPAHTYTPHNAYTVTLKATSNQGCTKTFSNTLLIHPLPVLTFSAPNVCDNAPVQFVNTSSINPGFIATYGWDFADGNTSSTMSPIHTFTGTGLKTVSLTATSNQGCVSSGTTTLNVHPYPTNTLTTINSSCINELVSFNSNLGITSGSIPSTTVSFGDASASTFTATTSLTVSHTYTTYNTFTINITAVSDMGCQSTFTNTVNVYPKPFVSFVPSNFCYRDSTFFNNTSIIPTGSISSHYWTFTDGSASSTIKNPKHKFSAAGNYTVTLTEFSQPEAGLTCSLNASQVVTVNPLPVPSFSTNTVCQGFTTLFGNLTPSAGITGWTWDFTNDATADDTQQNPGFIYAAAGTYTASLVAKNNFNCTDTVRSPVMVYSNPTVAFTAPNVCLGNVTTFTNQTIAPAGTILTYLWNFGDSDTSATQNPAHTYTPHNAYTVTLKATSNQGCTKTFSNTLLIHPLPVLTFSAPNVCDNAPVQFVNTSSINPGFIATYGWDFADGNTSSTMSPIHTFTGTGLKTVSLTATSNQGCVSSGTTTLNVHPYPTSTLTTINSSCINELVSFNSNLGITSGSIPSTTVSFGDASVSTFTATTSLTVSHTYTTYNTFTINITAVSDKGCQSTFTNTVKVYPKPFVNFTVTSLCEQDTTMFTNQSIIPTNSNLPNSSIYAHSWTFPPSAITSTLAHPKISLPSTGVYTVSLTEYSEPEAGLSCSATAVKQITIHPRPVVSFSANTVCQGLPTIFSNLTNTLGISGWTWDFTNDGTADNYQQNPVFIYPPPGGFFNASLSAINNFGCKKSATLTVQTYSNPAPSFVSSSVCLGAATSFTNQTPPLNGFSITYTWITAGAAFSNNQTASYTYTNSGIHPVILTASSSVGCVKQYTAPARIYELPNANFISNTVCFNTATTFTNLASISTGTISKWRWDFENNGLWDDSTDFHSKFIYPTPGSFNVKLEVTSNHGCISVLTKSVLVRILPIPNFSVKTNSVCIFDPVPGVNLSTSTEGTLSAYKWDFDGDGVYDRDTKDPVYTYSASGAFSITMAVTNQYSCRATKTNTIFINPKATPLFKSDNSLGCPELCVNFNDVSTVPFGYKIINRRWIFGDGSPAYNKAPTDVTHCYSTGVYNAQLTLTTDSGCVSNLNLPGFVTVLNNPVASFVTDPPEVDENQPLIEIQSTATDAAISKFYISDGTSYTGTNVTHSFKKIEKNTRPMIVQVVSNAAGCSDTTYKLLDIKPAFIIYIPNAFTPNGDGLNDYFVAKGVGIVKFSMQIFDRWGHIVYTSNNINETWNGNAKGNEEPIKQDTYIWKAQVTDVYNKSHALNGVVTVLR